MLRSLTILLFTLWLTACSESMETASDHHTYESFDGQTLAYLDRGEGPIVLMLHGLTSNAEVNFGLTGLASAVEREGYRVIAPDLRGHGGSSVANRTKNWPVDAMARDQIALLEALEAERVTVVGYSTGALVALRMQVLAAPAEKMLLGGMGDKTAVIGDRTRHDGIAALLARIQDGETGPLEERVSAMLDLSDSSADSVAGSLRHRMTVTREDIAEMDIPVLILNGEADQDNGDGQALANMFPQARFDTVPGNHLTALRDPAYAEKMAAFIAKD